MAKHPLPSRAGAPKKKGERHVRHYLKQWRAKRGMTQQRLADAVEKSRGLIAQYEIGETEIPEGMLYELAVALRCDPWDILRVNPEKEGDVVDITDELRQLDAKNRSEALGYIRGLKDRKSA